MSTDAAAPSEAIRSVSAIVVVWNGGDEAVEALASLLAQEVPGADYRVVAVDNGSTDGSVGRIRAALPGVEVLELGRNLGYGAAANRAFAAFPADAYLVANQDAHYRPGFAAALVHALRADPAAGAATAQVRLAGTFVPAGPPGFEPEAASRARNPAARDGVSRATRGLSPAEALGGSSERVFVGHDGARWRRSRPGERGVELLNSTGNEVTVSGNGRDRGWLAPLDTEFPSTAFGVHGGACALRAAAVEPLGGFDERYFMYYEDTDLSWRLRGAGWRIRYAPEAVSVHRHAASSGTGSERFVFWNARNRLWCALRHGPGRMRIAAVARSLAAAAAAGLRAADPRRPATARKAELARIRGVVAGLVPPRTAWAGQLGGSQPVLARLTAAMLARSQPGAAPLEPGSTGSAEREEGIAGASRILLDFTALPPQLGGVGRYLEGLLQGLSELGAAPLVVARRRHLAHFRALAPQVRLVAAPRWIEARGARFWWEQTGLPRLAQRLGAVAIHSPHYTFPLATRLGRVVTVHDATFFTDPRAHSRVKGLFFRGWLRLASRAEVRLIAPSRATADEVVRYAGTPRRPITVAHHGVDRSVFHPPAPAELAAFRARHGLGEARWIAFLGTIEPRKQLTELLAAHRELRDADPAAPLLLIAGARGWDAPALTLLDAAVRDPAAGVRELGYLPLEELRALLGGADAVCYPSIAEGFGLPVLEALASGAAVVTTRRAALPEVGGEAVLYVEPQAAAIADGLRALLGDGQLRARLREAGIERAASFTWARCAERHLRVYREAVR